MAKKLKCFLYTRVSTEMQVDGYSLEAQQERLVKEANHREMKIIGEYSDEGKSGKNIKNRLEFQRMLNDIQRLSKDERPDYVLVFKLSRFGRNAADTLGSLQFMEDYGVHLLCVEDGIDSAGAAGKLMISVLAAVAEIERENILEQTMAGREQKARSGEWNGGLAPYGYKLVYDENSNSSGKLVINEEEVEAVRLIYRMYTTTEMGLAGVARWLNENGYRKIARQNGTLERFATNFIKLVIDNPVYCGKIAYGRRRTEKIDGTRNEYHVVKQAKDSYELYDGIHEAIIEEDMWRRAQAKRAVNAFKREKTHSLEHEHVLSGLLKCPICGSSMYGVVNRKSKKDGSGEFYTDMFYYLCKNRKLVSGHYCTYKKHLRQDLIDAEVESVIMKALSDADFLNEFESMRNQNTDVDALYADIERMEALKRKEEAKKAKILQRIMQLDPDDETYDTLYDDLSGVLQEFTRTIAELDASIEKVEINIETVKQSQMMFISADELKEVTMTVLKEMSSADKKEFMNGFIERIELFEERQKNGRQVKSIKFKIPAKFETDGDVEELIVDDFLPYEKQDETVALLSKK